jgi:hypothetical protein
LEERKPIGSLYLLKEGEVIAYKDHKKICYLAPNQIFGEESIDAKSNISEFT